jgi:hypothetical protein
VSNPQYTYDCVVGPCVPSSWTTALPITLTVDFFNQVFEHDETNNVSTVIYPPPIPTPCPPTQTATRTSTVSPTSTATITATNTPPSCIMAFSDVQPTDYFYEAVRYLYCRGDISGYGDGTFRPYNFTTRGQVTKIVVLGFDMPFYEPPPPLPCTFRDVCEGDPFRLYVETAVHYEIISGYADGTFRPYNLVTRGQLAKILALAGREFQGWSLVDPPLPTFSDVPRDNPFYTHIETAACHGIISGYADGTFRWSNNATRGQIAKMVHQAVTSSTSCGTPTPLAKQSRSRYSVHLLVATRQDDVIRASVPLTTPTASPTFTVTPTVTPCPMHFSDVQPTEYFYQAVRYLYCDGVISGYADGTFRPYADVTRAQAIKMMVLAYDIPFYTPPSPTFPCDVPASHPFYIYIESYWNFIPHGIGFPPDCFRPYNWMTRGQLAKVVVTAGCWELYTPPAPTFRDVPSTDVFYREIETAYHLGVISGYTCGAGCLEYRPYSSVTRGQASKIIRRASVIGTSCSPPVPTVLPNAP